MKERSQRQADSKHNTRYNDTIDITKNNRNKKKKIIGMKAREK